VRSLAIDKIAPKILEEMKATAPVRTGALRDSLKIDRRGPAVAVIGAFRGVQNGAGWRAHFVEDGTAHTPPRPFIKPAGRKFQGEFARTLVTMPVFGK
jgi:HK97 gp10 family phage protein